LASIAVIFVAVLSLVFSLALVAIISKNHVINSLWIDVAAFAVPIPIALYFEEADPTIWRFHLRCNYRFAVGCGGAVRYLTLGGACPFTHELCDCAQLSARVTREPKQIAYRMSVSMNLIGKLKTDPARTEAAKESSTQLTDTIVTSCGVQL
jgi:hypothetical protein